MSARTIRLDAETTGSTLFFWTCEDCGAFGQHRGSRNAVAAAEFGTVHAQLCTDDFDVEVTFTNTFTHQQAATAALHRAAAAQIGA